MNVLLTTVLSSILLMSCAVLVLTQAAPSAVVYFQPPKHSARSHSVNTQDWDLIYKFLNKVGVGSKNSGIRRSQQEHHPTMTAFGSLLYGLSMAAGLALGVSISESPILNAFINGLDYRFMTRRSHQERVNHPIVNPVAAAPKIGDPQIHPFVAPSKDGKDHYHHVVHYHIPYPLSVGALEIARQNYPHISWYGSGPSGPSATPEKSTSVLSGYLGPMYKAPDVMTDKSLSDFHSDLGDDMRRNDRHDFKVFSEAEYFRNLHRDKPKAHHHQHHRYVHVQKADPPKVQSLEDMLLTDTNNPNLLGELNPNHQTTESQQNPSNVTQTPRLEK